MNSTNAGSYRTPTNREIHIEAIQSQARNDILKIKALSGVDEENGVVYVGSNVEYFMDSKTATGGYEELTHFIIFDPTVFELVDAHSTWLEDPTVYGVTPDSYYADACLFINDINDSEYFPKKNSDDCLGVGKGGDDVNSTFTYEVIGQGSFTLQGVIYDFSGSSFHYNADFNSSETLKSVNAILADWGDLPDTYLTSIDANGSRHDINATLTAHPGINPYLGTTPPDHDINGTFSPSVNADWDDTNGTDDEDGVFFGNIQPGQEGNVTVYVSNCTSQGLTCYVYGWIDFNENGTFEDNETIYSDVNGSVVDGNNTLLFSVPATVDPASTTYARFRISTDAGLTWFGFASDGEVEDYVVETLPVTLSYVYPTLDAGDTEVSVDFTTASEHTNAGFDIYGITANKKPVKLNDALIAGAIETAEANSYAVTVPNALGKHLKAVYIVAIDLNGNEAFHGPYAIGIESGIAAENNPIDWTAIHSELAAFKAGAANKNVHATLNGSNVNVFTENNAVYEVTDAVLSAAGIDLSGVKGNQIALSFRAQGVARYIDGLDKKGKWTDDSRIVFMGSEPSAYDKLYVSANTYQISVNKKLVVERAGIPEDYARVYTFEKNKAYSLVLPSDDPFYDGLTYSYGVGTTRTLQRTISMPELGEGSSTVRVDLSVFSRGTHHVKIKLNGTVIADEYASGYMAWPISATVDNSLFRTGSNSIAVTVIGEKSGVDVVFYDKTTVSFTAVSPNAIETAAVEVSEKSDIAFSKHPNYLIISHPMFMGDALAGYVAQRESEGWKVKVISVEDIYNAYGYGMATPAAIEDYLEDAEHFGVTHVQLVGASTYDNNNYLGYGAVSFIPTPYVKTGAWNHFTPSDAALVSDENAMPTMAIGRWPVRTLAGLEAVINKTMTWSTGQAASKRALLIADKNGGDASFSGQMESMAARFATEGGWSELNRVYLSSLIAANGGDEDAAVAQARAQIKSNLEEGATITMYVGHSSTSLWSFSGLLKSSDIASINNAPVPTLALPFACYTTYADSPFTNTLAHQLVAAGENGAVAVFGAVALSKAAENEALAKGVVTGLLNYGTIGESIQDAKISLGKAFRDVSLNNNLMGDVTLKLKK